MVNCEPSRETSKDTAVVLALASVYRSVSNLMPKFSPSSGHVWLLASQYSMIPAQHAQMPHIRKAGPRLVGHVTVKY